LFQVSADFYSGAILADATPPQPVMVHDRPAVYMSANCTLVHRQSDRSRLNVCWAEFVEVESVVTKYEVQYIRIDGKCFQ
jgi:hypothetical protein